MMDKAFLFELQQALLEIGYVEAEIRYYKPPNIVLAIQRPNRSQRSLGLLLPLKEVTSLKDPSLTSGKLQVYFSLTDRSHTVEYKDAKELANKIWTEDPDNASDTPDFRKFTGYEPQ